MTRRRLSLAAVVLLAAHLLALLADFVAPYPHAQQNRELPFAPPTALRFVDAEGGLHLVPFVYRLRLEDDGYVEERDRRFPLRFLANGEPYRPLGLFETRRRLISVDEPARLLWMGTDGLGRDVFSRLVFGARVSLFAGLLGATLALLLGTAIGLVSGFYAGWVDGGLMRLAEVFMALPWLYLLIAARAVQPLDTPPVRSFLVLVVILGCFGWPRPARLVRGVALSAREREYVQAARGFGAGDGYLLFKHVLPQTLSVVVTQGALLVPQFILAEVGLSFLGVGIADSIPTWGNMLGELQQYHVLVSSRWWLAWPGVALVVVVLAYHALARGVTVRRS
jgi:peptide/nickel transport system permease protein